jgi:hypothetical protein
VYKRKIKKSEKCLNCEESLSGENFCPNCGQLNNERKPNVFELFFEMMSNLFAFDSKFYRSVGPLLFKPGSLSVAFIDGKRQQFMLPIRMFIVITILFLTVNSFSNRSDFIEINTTQNSSAASDSTSEIQSVDDIFERLIARDTLSVDEGLKKLNLKPTFINRLFYQQGQKLIHNGLGNFLNYFFSKFLIYGLLFIPFLAMLLKLFYLNLPRYYYIDHFIFAVHQQTVLMILALITLLLNTVVDDSDWAVLILLIAFVIHFLKALKTFYKEVWWLTIFKFILINIGFFVISLIFVVLAGTATFLLY